jgi:hypothetical protein
MINNSKVKRMICGTFEVQPGGEQEKCQFIQDSNCFSHAPFEYKYVTTDSRTTL